MDDFLVIESVSRSFGRLRALDDVSLAIREGEAFSLLGPSGCGKTTLLRLIAGFEAPDAGRIFLGGKDITALPPERRPVNTVFQNYALFPHLSVRENIAFGPRMAGWPRERVRESVEQMLALVKLESHAGHRPAQLSGGQKQRAALARALVNRPRVLLLDEPLAALDLKLRQHLLVELGALHREVGATFIYVTHDQWEAMSLSHRIAVMNQGRIEQIAAPEQLYARPATDFVASFIGDTNLVAGRITEDGNAVRFADGTLLPLPEKSAHPPGTLTRWSIRPEHVHSSRHSPSDEPGTRHSMGHGRPACAGDRDGCSAVVSEIIYLGTHTHVWIESGPLRWLARMQGPPAFQRGAPVSLPLDPAGACELPAPAS